MAYTENEQRILDMWPKYEDGSYVMHGDKVAYDYNGDEHDGDVVAIRFPGTRPFKHTFTLEIDDDRRISMAHYIIGSRVKRPAPKVLDADGVEIKVGDTVYEPRMYGDNSFTVSHFTKNSDGKTLVMVDEMGSGLFPSGVTHTRPDSWERLKDDATMPPWSYCDKHGLIVDRSDGEFAPTNEAFAFDLIRRAKALAEKEAAR